MLEEMLRRLVREAVVNRIAHTMRILEASCHLCVLYKVFNILRTKSQKNTQPNDTSFWIFMKPSGTLQMDPLSKY